MKNNLLLFTIALLLLGLSACQKDSLTEAPESSNEAVTERGSCKPFKAKYKTTFQTVGEENGVITLSIKGKGHGNQLGESTWKADSWIDANQFPFLQTGDMKFKAENGDKLFGHFSGIATPDGQGKINFEGTFEITGGTGEFECATGSGTYWGWALEAEGKGRLRFDGTLNNP